MKKEKAKKPYSYFSNLRFILHEQWKCSKVYLFLTAATIPLQSVSALIAAFLPKVVLDCLERQSGATELLWKVGVMSAAVVLIRIVQNSLEGYRDYFHNLSADRFWRMKILEKTMDMDYTVFVRKGTRSHREKAMESLMQNGPEVYIYINALLFSALFGFSHSPQSSSAAASGLFRRSLPDMRSAPRAGNCSKNSGISSRMKTAASACACSTFPAAPKILPRPKISVCTKCKTCSWPNPRGIWRNALRCCTARTRGICSIRCLRMCSS